jgi:hypothetical protein
VVANNVWSFAGRDAAAITDVINRHYTAGLVRDSSPIVTANWKADSNDRWTVPLGGGFGKIFKIGAQALNGQVQAFYNVVSPDNVGGNWTSGQLQLLFPNSGTGGSGSTCTMWQDSWEGTISRLARNPRTSATVARAVAPLPPERRTLRCGKALRDRVDGEVNDEGPGKICLHLTADDGE